MPRRGWKPSADQIARHKTKIAARLGPAADRLMRYVEPDLNSGCWLWTGTLLSTGYGQIVVNGRTVSSHRLSYETFRGPIGTGLFVCHRCDTPACVNPDHLFLGTNSDNILDCVRKGRANNPRGDRHARAKLRAADIGLILARLEAGESCAEIAKSYGVTDCAINAIRRGKSWTHVTGLQSTRRRRRGSGGIKHFDREAA